MTKIKDDQNELKIAKSSGLVAWLVTRSRMIIMIKTLVIEMKGQEVLNETFLKLKYYFLKWSCKQLLFIKKQLEYQKKLVSCNVSENKMKSFQRNLICGKFL